MAEITTDPSPRAEATRLTDPARTSPTANTPGTDVTKPSGDYESFGVELDARLGQPGRAGVRANHQEETGCVEPDVPLEDVVPPGQRAEPTGAIDRGQLRARVNGDPFVVGEALRQIFRHRVAEVLTADQDVDLAGVPCQEQGGLAGRVRAPHHDGVPARHHLGFELARGIVNASSLEVGQARHVQASIPDAAGNDHGASHDVELVVEPDAEASGHLRHPRDRAGDTSLVPNLTACSIAARASSAPETPRGKPR